MTAEVQRVHDSLTASQLRVLTLVEARPGLTIVEAAKALGCSHATATYHLNLLVRGGYIGSRRDGREVRHFVAGLSADPAAWLRAVCRDARKRDLVLLLASPEMPMTLNDMSRRLAVPFGSLKRTLVQFQAQALVDMERRGFRYVVRPSDALMDFAKVAARAPAVVVEMRPRPAPGDAEFIRA